MNAYSHRQYKQYKHKTIKTFKTKWPFKTKRILKVNKLHATNIVFITLTNTILTPIVHNLIA